MRFSVWPNLLQPWADVLELARHAETTGWDGLYVADHFMGDGGGFGAETDPHLEATAVLGALAGLTTRLRLGPLVLGSTYRHPAVTANWAATMDHTTGGRFVLGLGAGWQRNEHEQYGIDLPPVRERVDRFREVCTVVRSLLHETRTRFDGHWFHLDDAVCNPKPAGTVPILVGGKGDRMLAVAARHADEWNMWGLPPTIEERSAVLDRACERIGRDPATIRRSTQALMLVTDDPVEARAFVERSSPRAAVAGTPELIAATVAEWRRVGVDEVIVPDGPLGQGARRAEAYDALLAAFRSI